MALTPKEEATLTYTAGFPVFHKVGKTRTFDPATERCVEGCGEVAFWVPELLRLGDVLPCDKHICESCYQPIRREDLSYARAIDLTARRRAHVAFPRLHGVPTVLVVSEHRVPPGDGPEREGVECL